MPSYVPTVPSGSSDGEMILVAATATAGTVLHTSIAGTTHLDEVWVWAVNDHTSDVLLSIELGDVTDPGDVVRFTVPSRDGLHLVIPGIRLQNGDIIAAFAATTNVISCAVNVNRILLTEGL